MQTIKKLKNRKEFVKKFAGFSATQEQHKGGKILLFSVTPSPGRFQAEPKPKLIPSIDQQRKPPRACLYTGHCCFSVGLGLVIQIIQTNVLSSLYYCFGNLLDFNCLYKSYRIHGLIK